MFVWGYICRVISLGIAGRVCMWGRVIGAGLTRGLGRWPDGMDGNDADGKKKAGK